ncbi:MAG TPA: hypothetical protein VN717_02415 [Gemmatimonadaceae bacterium]|nr:hypothetical protein [Gemmatimonadaceae bacterium]
MPHNEGYYYAGYFVAMGIYTLYAISLWRRRQTVAMRRLSLRRER